MDSNLPGSWIFEESAGCSVPVACPETTAADSLSAPAQASPKKFLSCSAG